MPRGMVRCTVTWSRFPNPKQPPWASLESGRADSWLGRRCCSFGLRQGWVDGAEQAVPSAPPPLTVFNPDDPALGRRTKPNRFAGGEVPSPPMEPAEALERIVYLLDRAREKPYRVRAYLRASGPDREGPRARRARRSRRRPHARRAGRHRP